MKQNRICLLAFMLICLLACGIPGLEAPAAGPADPKVISTIVVSTANAAASQTAVAQPVATGIPAGTTGPAMTGTTMEQWLDWT